MRLTRLLTRFTLPTLILLGACNGDLLAPLDPDSPSNLTYQLIPSGDPDVPLGVLLTWDAPRSGRAHPEVAAGLTGVTAISAGSGHALALTSDGRVWSWGIGP